MTPVQRALVLKLLRDALALLESDQKINPADPASFSLISAISVDGLTATLTIRISRVLN